MNKKLLILLFGCAFGFAVFLSNGFADDQPAPVPADTSGSVSPSATPAVSNSNKLFRKKHSDYSEAAKKDTSDSGGKQSFFSRLFSGKKKAAAAPVTSSTAQQQTIQNTQAEQPAQQGWAPIKKPGLKVKGKFIGADQFIRDAKEFYVRGKLEDAESNINKALQIEPQDKTALYFKNKIALIKEKMSEAKRDYSEQCYFRAVFYYREDDPLDALLLTNKALKINPQSDKAKALYAGIQAENQQLIGSLGKQDGRKLSNAINYFAREDFGRAEKIFRELQGFYPATANFLGFAVAHSSDPDNKKRAGDYVKEAIKDVRNERYVKAQEDLFEALEMDRENVDAQVILEQVKIELNSASQSEAAQSSQPAPEAQ